MNSIHYGPGMYASLPSLHLFSEKTKHKSNSSGYKDFYKYINKLVSIKNKSYTFSIRGGSKLNVFSKKNKKDYAVIIPTRFVRNLYWGGEISKICDIVRKDIAAGNLDGLFRSVPPATLFSPTDLNLLTSAAKSDERDVLVSVLKKYMDDNFNKFSPAELDACFRPAGSLSRIMQKKINSIQSVECKSNILAIFDVVREALEHVSPHTRGLTKESIIIPVIPALLDMEAQMEYAANGTRRKGIQDALASFISRGEFRH